MINCEAISSLAPINPAAIPKDDPSPPVFLKNVIELDKSLSAWLHRKALRVRRAYFYLLEYSGDGRFWLPVTAAMWLAPSFPHLEFRSFLFNLFLGFVFDLLLVGALKHLVRRPRPVYNKGMGRVIPVDHWSFPSGHATRTFFIATYSWLHLVLCAQTASALLGPLLRRMHSPPFLQVALEAALVSLILTAISVWALATSLSRVLLGRHYLLDVLMGCVLGIGEGFVVYYYSHGSSVPIATTSAPINK